MCFGLSFYFGHPQVVIQPTSIVIGTARVQGIKWLASGHWINADIVAQQQHQRLPHMDRQEVRDHLVIHKLNTVLWLLQIELIQEKCCPLSKNYTIINATGLVNLNFFVPTRFRVDPSIPVPLSSPNPGSLSLAISFSPSFLRQHWSNATTEIFAKYWWFCCNGLRFKRA